MLIAASSTVGEEEEALILILVREEEKEEEKVIEFGLSERKWMVLVLVLVLRREGTQTEHWIAEQKKKDINKA